MFSCSQTPNATVVAFIFLNFQIFDNCYVESFILRLKINFVAVVDKWKASGFFQTGSQVDENPLCHLQHLQAFTEECKA